MRYAVLPAHSAAALTCVDVDAASALLSNRRLGRQTHFGALAALAGDRGAASAAVVRVLQERNTLVVDIRSVDSTKLRGIRHPI